jgi:phosphatidate cytidylyltransferase
VLGKRILTALILAPAAIAAILLLPSTVFALVVAVLLLLGGREWADLAGAARLGGGLYPALLLVLGVLWILEPRFLDASTILTVAAAWWALVLLLVIAYPAGRRVWNGIPALGAGVLVLFPAWIALGTLHGTDVEGPRWLLVLMILIWGADTGAYFAGRAFGRHRLAPAVSPGKTWEGVLGGMALGIPVAVALAWALGLAPPPLFWLLAVVTVAASVLGDLAESLLKRVADRKDSGTLFPGHGGVMDRIDSVTAAAPIFALGLEVLA